MIAQAYHYNGHTLYTDGRLYQDHALIGQYKTEAAAKAQASRRWKAQHAEQSAKHHQRIADIWSR